MHFNRMLPTNLYVASQCSWISSQTPTHDMHAQKKQMLKMSSSDNAVAVAILTPQPPQAPPSPSSKTQKVISPSQANCSHSRVCPH